MPSRQDPAAADAAELRRLAGRYDFPDFVKQADVRSALRAPPGTPAAACADPVNRQFWCHTKAATWLSHLLYHEKKASFQPQHRRLIEGRLAEFARFWQITPECAAVAARQAASARAEKAAADGSDLPDDAFAFVRRLPDGRTVRRYPLRSAAEVKAAAEWVRRHRDRIPFALRHEMATRILEKGAAYGTAFGDDLREFLDRQAGRGVCDPAEVVTAVRGRALLLADGPLRDSFLKMAEAIRATPAAFLHPTTLVRLADTLDRLDRKTGLAGRYGDGLARPEDVVFKATFHKAGQDLARVVTTTAGACYEKAAFRRLNADDLRDLFGREFAERVTNPLGQVDPEKMAEEVAALPRPDAEQLEAFLRQNGIAPLMRKAASARTGFTPAQLARLAAAYRRTRPRPGGP